MSQALEQSSRRTLGRGWDSYAAYLFDIDGTLLTCTDAVHYFAFCEALTTVAGRLLNLDGVTAHGNTDVGILRDAFQLAGVDENAWRPRLAETRHAMCRFVSARSNDLRIAVLPGVHALIDHLQSKGAVCGVATGNLEGIGRLKLERCGLLKRFAFGAYSDACEYRKEVFAGALNQARALAGVEASVCVVGDTPEDIRAARANGLDVIAVATGIYAFDGLAAEHPDWCVNDLRELVVEGS